MQKKNLPLQIIEAPSAPSQTIDEVEQERARQEAIGTDVLQQIQMFGESANDEFDVSWATRALEGSPGRVAATSAASMPTSTAVPTSTVTVRSVARPVETAAVRSHHPPSVSHVFLDILDIS